jgi:PAS domain S-box-containing protein
MTAMKDSELHPRQLEPQVADLGMGGEHLPLHAHAAYFWETNKEFAEAVGFLEVGLRGADHCVIFGHEEANQAVCQILRERGFDLEALQAQRRLSVLGGSSSGDLILGTIAATFEQAVAGGAPLIRLLGNIGWHRRDWPEEEDLLAFEAKVTAATKEFPCVVVCLYDLRALSGPIVHHGAFETHPLIVHHHSVHQNPYHVPTEVFLEHLEAIAADIAERRRMEAALKKSEERFRALFESAPIGISINDAEGRFIQVNESFQTMLQYPEDELRGLSFREITVAEDLAESERLFGELREGKRKEFQVEQRYQKKNGDLLWGNTHCAAVRDASGNFVYTFAMVEDVSERKRAERILRAITEGTAASAGSDFFRSLVRHLAQALQVRYSFIAECTDETKTRVRTLAFWTGEGFSDSVDYLLRGTPCEQVIGGEACHYPERLQGLFPEDKDLVALNAESYLGVPLHSPSGDILGHLVAMDTKPMPALPRDVSILRIFAARAGVELRRQQAEERLRAALSEVERLKNRLHAENVYLQEEIRREHNFEEIVGSSPALLAVLQEVERVAPTDASVLIFGETGTGKELIARAIHNRSTRQARPLVKVNCGAISAGLVESELFGHVKGAFTGAFERRTGRFELANGGTLFLDEVGELPLETQVKLLRVLQEGEFEPVGSSRTVRVDVRIIAATNRHLEEAVQAGRFRSDLFYRLNVFPIRVPALRERRSDIPQLVLFFLSRAGRKFGKRIEGVSQETMELFVNYSWPGNVRELQNLIERSVVLSEGPILTLSQNLFPASSFGEGLTAQVSAAAPAAVLPSAVAAASAPATQAPFSLEEIERQHILSVLEQTRWIIEGPQGAAKLLNLHPNTLRGRMKKLGIQRPS